MIELVPENPIDHPNRIAEWHCRRYCQSPKSTQLTDLRFYPSVIIGPHFNTGFGPSSRPFMQWTGYTPWTLY